MRRVLLLDLSQRFGGADVRVIDTALHLKDRFDMHVAVLKGSEAHQRLSGTTELTIWPHSRSRRDPRLAHDLYQLMSRLRPSVADAHNAQSILWGLSAAAAARVPVRLATVHSHYKAETWRHSLHPQFSRFIDCVGTGAIAVQRSVAEHLKENGYRRHPLYVIENGVSITEAARPAKPDSSFTICIPARLVRLKNHALLFQAIQILAPEYPHIKCRVLGDGPLRSELEQLATRLGIVDRVEFLGFQPNVVEYMAASTMVCLPSTTEALPYAALEAAALGVPIVASALPGIQELFTDKVTARIFALGDANALASALSWTATNPEAAKEMGRLAAETIRSRYTLETMLSRTAEIYNDAK